jgi:sugar lactone lactonase YvrE
VAPIRRRFSVQGEGVVTREYNLVLVMRSRSFSKTRPTECGRNVFLCRGAVLLLACLPVAAQQYTISTIAAGLNNPTSVAADGAGNVYFSDWSGLIRKIWARDRAVSVVAGTGIIGYSGDGGQATSAKIGKGISLAADDAGDIYIADGDNNRIRRVEAATGIITTVAGNGASTDSGDGGLAINAGVSRPTGIAFDAAGDLYFSSNWSRVRKLKASTGTIETIAGRFATSFAGDNGPAVDALFWDPVPGAVDAMGNVYIADFENSRVRMITAATKIVATIAGAGACSTSPPPLSVLVCQGGFGGDGGPASEAVLNHAQSVGMDAEGNLYIADTINHRVRKIDARTGVIYTIAGNGASGFAGDGGTATAAEITTPTGIAVDGTGKVYFADEANGRIRVLTPPIEAYRPDVLRPRRPFRP